MPNNKDNFEEERVRIEDAANIAASDIAFSSEVLSDYLDTREGFDESPYELYDYLHETFDEISLVKVSSFVPLDKTIFSKDHSTEMELRQWFSDLSNDVNLAHHIMSIHARQNYTCTVYGSESVGHKQWHTVPKEIYPQLDNRFQAYLANLYVFTIIESIEADRVIVSTEVYALLLY